MELLLLVFLLLALIFILIKEKFKPRYKFLPDERTEENNLKAYQWWYIKFINTLNFNKNLFNIVLRE